MNKKDKKRQIFDALALGATKHAPDKAPLSSPAVPASASLMGAAAVHAELDERGQRDSREGRSAPAFQWSKTILKTMLSSRFGLCRQRHQSLALPMARSRRSLSLRNARHGATSTYVEVRAVLE